jgi:hypothetical protein
MWIWNSQAQCFFVPILWCRQSDDNFNENLVKVGYKKDKKVKMY